MCLSINEYEQCNDYTPYSLSSAALCSCPQRSVECAVHVECADVARHATGSPFLSQPALCQFLLETRANTNPFPFTVTSLMATTADTSRKQLTCTRTLAHTLAHTHTRHITLGLLQVQRLQLAPPTGPEVPKVTSWDRQVPLCSQPGYNVPFDHTTRTHDGPTKTWSAMIEDTSVNQWYCEPPQLQTRCTRQASSEGMHCTQYSIPTKK